jgi:hypothetical protein
MAAKDAASNAARVNVQTAKQMAEQQKRSERWEGQSKRETAVELAFKMCPPDMISSAEALLNDAEKIAAFIIDGKTPAKRHK